MRKALILSVIFFVFINCKKEIPFDVKKQNQMVELSEKIFAYKKLDSNEILKLIETNSTEIFQDTSKSDFIPKPLIYSNSAAKTFFKVYEKPKGKIFAISFYKNNSELYTAEYFDNGQIQCQFKVNKNGIKNGKYDCFHKNGKIRKSGEFLNDKEIGIEIGYDSIGNITHQFDYESMQNIK